MSEKTPGFSHRKSRAAREYHGTIEKLRGFVGELDEAHDILRDITLSCKGCEESAALAPVLMSARGLVMVALDELQSTIGGLEEIGEP